MYETILLACSFVLNLILIYIISSQSGESSDEFRRTEDALRASIQYQHELVEQLRISETRVEQLQEGLGKAESRIAASETIIAESQQLVGRMREIIENLRKEKSCS